MTVMMEAGLDLPLKRGEKRSAGPGMRGLAVAVIFASVLVAGGCTDAVRTPRSALLERVEEANADAEPFGNGTWEVGADIQPGIYRAWRDPEVLAGLCVGTRIGDAASGYSPLSGAGAYEGAAIIEISASDTRFRSENCTAWEPYRPPAEPQDAFGPGTVIAGLDVRPGLYVSANAGTYGACFWVKLPGLAGWPSGFDLENMSHSYEPRRAIVELSDADPVFESQGCSTWRRVDSMDEIERWPEIDLSDGIPPGLWLVGREVEPGTYVAEQDIAGVTECQWRRLAGFGGADDDVQARDQVVNIREPLTVSIEEDDVAFATDGCTDWRRVDS